MRNSIPKMRCHTDKEGGVGYGLSMIHRNALGRQRIGIGKGIVGNASTKDKLVATFGVQRFSKNKWI